MNRSDNEGFVWMLVIALGMVGLFIYFQVKSFADWVHLDWSSAAWLLSGILTLVAGVGVVFSKGWGLGKLFPWLLCGFYLFTLPALNFWSLSMPGRLDFRIDEYVGNIDRAWYGGGWWQFLIFVALLGGAYGLNKLREDSY